MDIPASLERRCLAVRSRTRKKSLPSFVKMMQKYFPYYFNSAVFTPHSLCGEKGSAMSVESILLQHASLPPAVIRYATHYLIRLRYQKDTQHVFERALARTKNDPVNHQLAQCLIREVRPDKMKGVAAVIRLVCLEYGKGMDDIPRLTRMSDDIRHLMIEPAGQTCRVLNQHVVYAIDREIKAQAGCLIDTAIIPALTESVIWLISFSASGATSDHRLRLLTLYVMMGQPDTIKQLGVICPHAGTYHLLDIENVQQDRLTLLKDCLYGTPRLTKIALKDIVFTAKPVRQAEPFALWYNKIRRGEVLPAPYVGLALSLIGGALEKGIAVNDIIDRLVIERKAIRQTGKASHEWPSLFCLDTVLTMLVVNDVSQKNKVLVLAIVETLLHWFNRVNRYTRLTSLWVQSAKFQNPEDDTICVKTNNQVALVKLNVDTLTTEGTESLIRQQVKLNNPPGVPLAKGMSRYAPVVSVINPLLGEALCYDMLTLPSVVYDLIVSDLLDNTTR